MLVCRRRFEAEAGLPQAASACYPAASYDVQFNSKLMATIPMTSGVAHMNRSKLLCLLACPLLVLLSSPVAHGQTPRTTAEETREFEILVKGKPAGRCVLRIRELDDGTTVATTDADVSLSFVVYTYRYEFHGQEIWRQGSMLLTDNRAVDGGKVLAARARNNPQGSIMELRDKPSVSGPLLRMTTNYWRLPAAETLTGEFSILEADTGAIHAVKLKPLGPDELVVEGRTVRSTHYRLSGDAAADLWFDAQQRLVRKQNVEEGYPTELRLVRIRATGVQ